MDLSKLGFTEAAEKGADLTLEHPDTGEKYDIIITLASKDSARYRTKEKEIDNRRMQKISRGKKANFIHTDAEKCELLAHCTLGWVGLAYESEDEMECSYKNAEYVYSKEYWIVKQVDTFMSENSHFLPNA